MNRDTRVLVSAGVLLPAFGAVDAELAQKAGGILKIGHFDSAASMSSRGEAAAVADAGNAGDRLDADRPMSRDPGADAPASDRHGPVHIRRIQAEPVDHAGAEPGLLETGPALPRRYRIPDHQGCIDPASFL